MQKNYRETRKRLRYAIIKHKVLFVLIIAVALAAGFICFPRNIGSLLIHNNTTAVEITKAADGNQEAREIALDENQQARLLELFRNNYVRLKVFHKDYVTKNFMGYMVMMPGTSDIVFYFSKDIISINNIQYKIYGQTFADKFISIIENEE